MLMHADASLYELSEDADVAYFPKMSSLSL